MGKFPEKLRNRPDPTFTPHFSQNSKNMQNESWIRAISRFFMFKVTQFEEFQVCKVKPSKLGGFGVGSSVTRGVSCYLKPITWYCNVIFGSNCLRKFGQVCARLRTFACANVNQLIIQ